MAATVDTNRAPLTRGDVMRAEEVADLLGVPVNTVYLWASKSTIPSRKRGRHRLFLRSEVEAWIMAEDDAS